MEPDFEKLPKNAEFWGAFANNARTVRSWFLAFGIGAPAIFVTNEGAAIALANSGYAHWVVALFLLGVALQVGQGLLSKHTMMYLFVCEGDPDRQAGRLHGLALWLFEAYWLDLVVDLLTCGLFIAATAITAVLLVP
ncbi:MAG: hypothetical protein AAFY08_07370 [Planctomycetota bacterium]